MSESLGRGRFPRRAVASLVAACFVSLVADVRATDIHVIGAREVLVTPAVIDPDTGDVLEPAVYATVFPFGAIDSTTGAYTELVADLGGNAWHTSLAWNPPGLNFYTFAERVFTTVTTSGSMGDVLATVPMEGDGLSWINNGLARSPNGTLYAYNFEADTFGTVTEAAPVYTAITEPGASGFWTDGPVGGRIAFHGTTLFGAFNTYGVEPPDRVGIFGTFNLGTGVFSTIATGEDYKAMVLASDGTTLYGLTPSTLDTLDPVSGAILASTSLSGSLPGMWTGAAVAVPEPATWVLGVVGLACGAWHASRRRMKPSRAITAFVLTGLWLAATTAQAAVNYEMVTVGNPGNAADTTGYGAVNSMYQIGKYEVTVGQYCEFLNAVAKSDPYELYNWSMGPGYPLTDYWGNFLFYGYPDGSIIQSGTSGSYTYSIRGSCTVPAAVPRWMSAARFANWMQNGQPTGPEGPGTTETGAYTLNGQVSGTFAARNPDATYFIPTEDQWYKAAFYDPTKGPAGGYWNYATRSDTAPGNQVGDKPNQANYYITGTGWSVGDGSSHALYRSPVGAFTASASYYGTFDQSGNLGEWNDLRGEASLYRGMRGGAYQSGAPYYSAYGTGSTELSKTVRVERYGYEYVGSDGNSPSWESIAGLRLAAPAAPTTSYWSSGAGIGGGGTWAANSGAAWAGNADGSGTKQAWSNGQTSGTAVFGGTPGTVTASGTVEVNTLSLASGGYTISGGTGSGIRFLGSAPAIRLANGVSTTISTNLTGSGPLAITGTGSRGTARLGGTVAVGGVRVTNALVSLSGTVQGDVSLAGDAGLAGSGRVTGTIGGAGSVNPGNSPGILTVNGVDPSGGLSFVFEFSDTAPNYADALGSINDVLRLTGSTPFVSAFDSSNTKTLFLNFTKAQLSLGTTLKGGFFTDLAGDFASLLNNYANDNAGFQVYVLGDGNGHDNSLNGQGYYNWRNPAMFGWTQSLFLSTTAETATFGSGSVNGRIMTLTVAVPEPSTWVLGLAGIACGGWALRRRRKRGGTAWSTMALALLFVISFGEATGSADAAITYELVTVGNPGNAADTTGYGSVNYEYSIGKYEVTIGQYCEFLNAVAKADTNDLWNASMGSIRSVAGISRSGSSGAYAYSVISPAIGPMSITDQSGPNRPITYVSWFDAARFANWMANGQPTGVQDPTTTENGAYDLSSWQSGTAPAKNATNPNTSAQPTFSIPTENDWYKAAYFSPSKSGASSPGYFLYATQSNTSPGNAVGGTLNQANHYVGAYPTGDYATTNTDYGWGPFDVNYLTDVGAFTNSTSFYGTCDQTGNVEEWNDSTGSPSSSRSVRGGSWTSFGDAAISASSLNLYQPSYEASTIGFRLAAPAPVPEPSTCVMALAGLACGGWALRRRRKPRASG